MASKYIKPTVKTIGDALGTAQGSCWSGSVANSTSSQLNCYAGGTASSYSCTGGSSPGSSCFSGNVPTNPGGCHPGGTPAFL